LQHVAFFITRWRNGTANYRFPFVVRNAGIKAFYINVSKKLKRIVASTNKEYLKNNVSGSHSIAYAQVDIVVGRVPFFKSIEIMKLQDAVIF